MSGLGPYRGRWRMFDKPDAYGNIGCWEFGAIALPSYPTKSIKQGGDLRIFETGATRDNDVFSPGGKLVREFATGATRDTDTDKMDHEGFISPLVTKRYGQYMHKHRVQADGTLRNSDNWQKGMPKDSYVKSLTRHVEDVKLHHDGYGDEATETLQDALCAVLFNASGLLFELLKDDRCTKEHQ